MGVTMRVVGSTLSKALKNINSYSSEVKEGVKKEIKYTALEVETEAKQNAPVRTGRLRASITHAIKKNGFGAVVGSNVKYAAAVEFGYMGRPAKPYLFPAAEKIRKQFLANIRKIFKNAK